MSKKSHAKHEHKAAQHHDSHKVAETEDYGPTYGERHRSLIIVVAILFFFLAPLTLAIFWLLGALSH